MIYELSIDLRGIEKYFDRYYKKLKHSHPGSRITPPRLKCKTPTVLLLNRQFFAEAVSLLSKKAVSFHHGLLGLPYVYEVVSEQVLQKLSSITITTKGHPILKKNIKSESWYGYMDLIADLSIILAKDHKLKTLTIDFEDKALERHTTLCWDGSNKCDFRDHMKEAFNSLRSIRGVGCVTLTGIPSPLTLELKARMESKPKSFLDLPGEIRNQIYDDCADWLDASTQLARTMKAWTDHNKPIPYPTKTTPTVLLLNKQIYDEAISVIHSKPLNLVFPSDNMMQKQTDTPLICRFISEETLLKVKHLSIRLEEWEWMYSMQELIPVFFDEKHSLETLHIYFYDRLKNDFLGVHPKKYPDGTLHDCLQGLSGIRGVRNVSFGGDLPDVYTSQMIKLMQRPNDDPNTLVPPFKAVRGDGAIVYADELGE